MVIIDVEELLRPLSDDAPCGADLEYDSDFIEMGRAAQRVPDQQYGDTVIPGKEPEWGQVKSLALGILKRTKDLRAAVFLAQAVLRTDGIPALGEAVSLIKGLIEQYWEPLYPRLDPDDDNDPTLRVNSIASLADNAAMVFPLQTLPIVRSRAVGNFSHRDIGIVTGEFPRGADDTDEEVEKRQKLIDAAFEAYELPKLRGDAVAASQVADLVKQLDRALTQQVGAGLSRSLDPLAKELMAIHKILADRLFKRGGSLEEPSAGGTGAGEVATSEGGSAEANVSAGAAGTVAGGLIVGGVAPAGTVVQVVSVPNYDAEISSRENAIKALERVCQYFEKYEPSSPLPLLLRRAKRLSTKSFLEILKDISPDGVGQAQTLGGLDNE